MVAPVNKMLRGMEEYFLAVEPIRALIASRLTRGIAEIRIVAHERPDQFVANRTGRFAEYELAGAPADKVLNGKSRMLVAAVDFRFFGQFIAHAAEVYDAFEAAWSGTLSTRWGEGQDYETKIMGAWWNDSTVTDDRDQTLQMSFVSATLVVPFCVV